MKMVEKDIKQKNNEIYKLKSELMTYKNYAAIANKTIEYIQNNNDRNDKPVSHKINSIKTQIAEKKLNVQKESNNI